ncbi:hypothetical protein ACHHYP_20213 [Achlya hypogyna]|uniref:WW domain-containing protein n=1 Tax=Achlya hypogyna TaxID=1202772 RepID=A0A1V9YY73_ACHHY|nr:hypothetical protein ACHHYP_20213 [Achlya hypogyna]
MYSFQINSATCTGALRSGNAATRGGLGSPSHAFSDDEQECLEHVARALQAAVSSGGLPPTAERCYIAPNGTAVADHVYSQAVATTTELQRLCNQTDQVASLQAEVQALHVRRYSGIWIKYHQAQGFRTWKAFTNIRRQEAAAAAHRGAAFGLWWRLHSRRSRRRHLQLGFMTWRRHNDATYRTQKYRLRVESDVNRWLRLRLAWQQWAHLCLRRRLLVVTHRTSERVCRALLGGVAKRVVAGAWRSWQREALRRGRLLKIMLQQARGCQRRALGVWRVFSRHVFPLHSVGAKRIQRWLLRRQRHLVWTTWSTGAATAWKERWSDVHQRPYFENVWTSQVQWVSPHPAPPVQTQLVQACALLLQWSSKVLPRRRRRAWAQWRSTVAHDRWKSRLRLFFNWRTSAVMIKALRKMQHQVTSSRAGAIATAASHVARIHAWYVWKQLASSSSTRCACGQGGVTALFGSRTLGVEGGASAWSEQRYPTPRSPSDSLGGLPRHSSQVDRAKAV